MYTLKHVLWKKKVLFLKLNKNKASQKKSDIPITIIHKIANIFADLSKCQFTLISFHQTNNADFVKDIVRSIAF